MTIQLMINNSKKNIKEFDNELEASKAAEIIEGERLFWMNRKAYGKENSYRIIHVFKEKVI